MYRQDTPTGGIDVLVRVPHIQRIGCHPELCLQAQCSQVLVVEVVVHDDDVQSRSAEEENAKLPLRPYTLLYKYVCLCVCGRGCVLSLPF